MTFVLLEWPGLGMALTSDWFDWRIVINMLKFKVVVGMRNEDIQVWPVTMPVIACDNKIKFD